MDEQTLKAWHLYFTYYVRRNRDKKFEYISRYFHGVWASYFSGYVNY